MTADPAPTFLPVEPDLWVMVTGPHRTGGTHEDGRPWTDDYRVTRPVALRLGAGHPDRIEYLTTRGEWAELTPDQWFLHIPAADRRYYPLAGLMPTSADGVEDAA